MDTLYLPNRLELALSLRAMTRADLASRIGVSATYMTLILNEKRDFNEDIMVRCAQILDVPQAFFQVPQGELLENMVSFRQKSRTPKKYIGQVLSEFTLATQTVERIASITHVDTLWGWIDDISVRDTPSLAKIESVAQEARSALKVSDKGMVPNVIRAIERGGISVAPLASPINNMDIVSEGISQNSPQHAPIIGYFSQACSGDRQRFTLAHELGHILLHRYRVPSDIRRKEREAHMFASAFLFPEEDARAFVRENTQLQAFIPLKMHWGISIASMITRSTQLGLISQERQRSLMKQLSARGWRTIEPVTIGYESPLLIKQMVGQSLGKLISPNTVEVSDVAVENFLGVPYEMLDTWSDGLAKAKDIFTAENFIS